ncbi:SnoaL-like domain-containing protein [Mucilaginibacter sp. PPCGB 2223]|uniref:SnoaL-like domain-containing protein n=1 Tax=Mucilaginibacter sp. PPCGB 2223 TaxID=1886027 RepID=UPI001112C5FB|nr:SnoaL-like domain-containing protein [Mucilaginibacter sp. PPCGB 2223]
MMTTQEVANRYYGLMLENKREQIVDELYGQDIICKEPEHALAMGIPTTTRGLEAVKAKAKARAAMIAEIHGDFCSEPLIAGNFFSVVLGRDLTLKGKPRMNLQEIGVFEVKEGKIVSEQFFY